MVRSIVLNNSEKIESSFILDAVMKDVYNSRSIHQKIKDIIFNLSRGVDYIDGYTISRYYDICKKSREIGLSVNDMIWDFFSVNNGLINLNLIALKSVLNNINDLSNVPDEKKNRVLSWINHYRTYKNLL